MGAEPFDDATRASQRKAKRARVLLIARLKSAAGDIEARLRDLSRKGALLECEQRFSVGDEVVFSRGDTTVPARIAWTGGNRVGLEFLEMIDESEVLVHISRPQAQPQQRYRRPRLVGEDFTDEERKLVKLWSRSVGISAPDS
jgi:hypothetical protein